MIKLFNVGHNSFSQVICGMYETEKFMDNTVFILWDVFLLDWKLVWCIEIYVCESAGMMSKTTVADWH